MGDIDAAASIKKVCTKRANDMLDPHCDAVLVSDDSVPDSPLFSVESVSMDTTSGDPMVPVTPHSKFEGMDYRLGLNDTPSPLAFPDQQLLHRDSQCKGGVFLKLECDSLLPFSSPKQQLLQCDSQLEDGDFSSGDSPRTPKKDVFDPFAPGPDKLNLAPYCRKYTEKSKVYVARKLKFDLCTKATPDSEDLSVSDEEIIFQSVYSDLLEVIMSTQTKENGNISCKVPFYDGYHTPIVPPLLTGVADTCPGAPIKISNRFRRIDKELCRQLEF